MLTTFHILLALLAFLSAGVAFVAMLVAAAVSAEDSAAIIEVSAELDAAADATYARTLVACLLASDFPSEPARATAAESFAACAPLFLTSVIRTLAPPALATVDGLEVGGLEGLDADATLASEPARPSGIYPAAARRTVHRAGFMAKRPVLTFEDDSAAAFLVGYTVRTPRGRTIPATVALYRRGCRPAGLRKRARSERAAA